MHAQVVVDGVQFPVDGASVAIVENGRVFVQFRPFPPGWELPGGHVETDENPLDAAAREVGEETGWEVRIRGLVGVYSWRGLRTVGDAVYLGEIVGGKRRRSLESVAGAWSNQTVIRFIQIHNHPQRTSVEPGPGEAPTNPGPTRSRLTRTAS